MSNPVTWFEVHTADPDRAKGFYGQLFGWTFTEEAPGYTMIGLGPDAPIGGGIAAGRFGQPPLAVFLVQVADVAAADHPHRPAVRLPDRPRRLHLRHLDATPHGLASRDMPVRRRPRTPGSRG